MFADHPQCNLTAELRCFKLIRLDVHFNAGIFCCKYLVCHLHFSIWIKLWHGIYLSGHSVGFLRHHEFIHSKVTGKIHMIYSNLILNLTSKYRYCLTTIFMFAGRHFVLCNSGLKLVWSFKKLPARQYASQYKTTMTKTIHKYDM